MIVVAIFLLIAYRFLGLVAVIGLAVYAAFLYAIILLFNVTLTLPSFAGMILTIGVAADANIVIFERIREEVHAGKSVRAAISAGYSKGFNSIIDANVITALTAVVLFVLATAGVKGFALMLLLGTAMSIVTAVFATRAMLALLAGFRWFSSPKFMGTGGSGIPKWIQHDYIGKRNIWFALSGVVLAAVGRRDRDQRAQLRHRLQGRHGDRLRDAAGPCPSRTCARRRSGSARGTRSSRASAPSRTAATASSRCAPRSSRPAEANELRGRLHRGGERARVRHHDGLGELRRADRRERDLRHPLLALPRHAVGDLPLPVEVRARGHGRARPRRADRDGDLLAQRPGGDDGHRGRDPHRARLLDVRHGHHPGPRSGRTSRSCGARRSRRSRTCRSGRRSAARWPRPSSRCCRSPRSTSSAARRSRTSRSRCSSASGPVRTRPSSSRRRSWRMLKEREPEYARRKAEGTRPRRRRGRAALASCRPRRPAGGPGPGGRARAGAPHRGDGGRGRAAAARARSDPRAAARGIGGRHVLARGARRQARAAAPAAPVAAARPRALGAAGGAARDGSRRRRLAALRAGAARARGRRRRHADGRAGGPARGRARGARQHPPRRGSRRDRDARPPLARRRHPRRRARRRSALEGTFRELGLVPRSELEDVELRLAQLEHRLRLLEGRPTPTEPV